MTFFALLSLVRASANKYWAHSLSGGSLLDKSPQLKMQRLLY